MLERFVNASNNPGHMWSVIPCKRSNNKESWKCEWESFPAATENSLQTEKKLCMPTSFISGKKNKKKLQLRLHKGSDFPFLCVAVFLCVCVWLFGLAGGERAAGAVLSGPDSLLAVFSRRADLPKHNVRNYSTAFAKWQSELRAVIFFSSMFRWWFHKHMHC